MHGLLSRYHLLDLQLLIPHQLHSLSRNQPFKDDEKFIKLEKHPQAKTCCNIIYYFNMYRQTLMAIKLGRDSGVFQKKSITLVLSYRAKECHATTQNVSRKTLLSVSETMTRGHILYQKQVLIRQVSLLCMCDKCTHTKNFEFSFV